MHGLMLIAYDNVKHRTNGTGPLFHTHAAVPRLTILRASKREARTILEKVCEQLLSQPESDTPKPPCKVELIWKRDGQILCKTVRARNKAQLEMTEQPTRETESNNRVQRNHITPAARDNAGVTPSYTGETPASALDGSREEASVGVLVAGDNDTNSDNDHA